MKEKVQECEDSRVYEWDKRNKEHDPLSDLVTVVNDGSKEFMEHGFKKTFQRLDLLSAAKRVLEVKSREDKARGNLQVNVLYTGGENQRRGPEEIHHHYGCAMPALNQGSDEWIGLAVEMSGIARQMGVPWADISKVRCPSFRKRSALFARRLDPRNVFEGLTIALLELFPNSGKIREHVDKLNCGIYTHTLLCSEIIYLEGKIYRIVVIAYMRKSCHDTYVRREACKEFVNKTKEYLQSIHISQMPVWSVAEHTHYYSDLGEKGLGMVLKTEPCGKTKVVYAALMNRPNVNKGMSYLSPLASEIVRLYNKHRHFGFHDLIGMCLPLAHLCGVFPYLTVLHQLSAESKIPLDPEIGILGPIMLRLVNCFEKYSGGPFPRHQVCWQWPYADKKRLAADIELVKNECLSSTEIPPLDTSYEQYCNDCFDHYTKLFIKKVLCAGNFTASHLLYTLVYVGALRPVGMLHCSRFALTASLFKEKPIAGQGRKSRLLQYINGASENTTKTQRGERVLDSALLHLKIAHPCMNKSFLEQINCESRRTNVACDMFGPGGQHLFLPPFDSRDKRSGGLSLQRMTPVYSKQMKSITVHVDEAIVTHGKSEEPLPAVGFDYGDILLGGSKKKSKKKSDYKCCRIPREYLDVFPGMWDGICEHFFTVEQENGNLQEPNAARAFLWLENNPVVMELARHFTNHVVPLRETENVPRGFKYPEDFAHLRASFSATDGNKRKLDIRPDSNIGTKRPKLIYQSAGLDCISDEEEEHGLHQDVLAPLPNDPPQLLPLLHHAERDDVFDDAFSACVPCPDVALPLSHPPLVQNAVSHNVFNYAPDISSDGLSDGITDVFSDAFSGGVSGVSNTGTDDAFVSEQVGSSIVCDVDYTYYKFSSSEQLKIVLPHVSRRPPPKRIFGHGKPSLVLGTLHSELKRALHTGTRCSNMPKSIARSTFLEVKCTGWTHRIEAFSGAENCTFHMTKWVGHDTERFYTVGCCVLADTIARYVGARTCGRKDTPGVINWVFNSQVESRRFLFQMLFLLGGRRAYFRSMYKRITKKIKEVSNLSHPDAVVVDLMINGTVDLGRNNVLFHAVVDSTKELDSMSWFLVPASTSKTSSSNLPLLNAWDWKDDNAMKKLLVKESAVDPTVEIPSGTAPISLTSDPNISSPNNVGFL